MVLLNATTKLFSITILSSKLKKSKVTGKPLTLIIFDLDHFKKLNDNYGHDAGDFVLKEKARLIRDNGIRVGDIFARYGGEEFCILLPNTNLKQGFEIAERLESLSRSINLSTMVKDFRWQLPWESLITVRV